MTRSRFGTPWPLHRRSLVGAGRRRGADAHVGERHGDGARRERRRGPRRDRRNREPPTPTRPADRDRRAWPVPSPRICRSATTSLSVQLSGFDSRAPRSRLKVGDQIDVPIVLQAAAVTEAVQVEAAAPLVEARRTQVAAAITPQEVDTLPLNGRNYLDLATARAECVAHQPADRRIALPKRRRCRAPASRSPVSAISRNSFIVDGLSANDDAADLAGTFFSEEVDPRVPGGHVRRRRGIRPRVRRHDQRRHQVGRQQRCRAASTSSSATTCSTRATRSRPGATRRPTRR